MKNINKNTIMILAVILILVALGGGFFAGMQYQKSQLRSLAINGQFADRGFGNGQGAFQRGMGGQRFTPLRGEVLSIGTGTMTVKQQDGTTKIVVIPSSAVFLKTQTGALSDLKSGDTVMVVGSSNSDGSVTATDVQINPQQFRPSAPGTIAPSQGK